MPARPFCRQPKRSYDRRFGPSTGDLLDSLADAAANAAASYGYGDDASIPVKSGNPSAVPFRPGNWWFDDINAPTRGEYAIASGDTMTGIAITYGGRGDLWLSDIWPLQQGGGVSPLRGKYVDRYANAPDPSTASASRPNPSPGMVLRMPRYMAEYAAQLFRSNAPAAPATPGTPGSQEPGGIGSPVVGNGGTVNGGGASASASKTSTLALAAGALGILMLAKGF